MTTDPAPSPLPAAFSPNGTSPASRTADAAERAASLLSQLPQAIGVMLSQVVRAIPSQHLCATCLVNRIAWEASHQRDLEAAVAKAREAHGLPPDSPLPPGFDPSPFLPEHLRPGGSQGMPNLTGAITTVNGTDTCSEHIPGRAAGRTLLIANGALSPSAMASLRG